MSLNSVDVLVIGAGAAGAVAAARAKERGLSVRWVAKSVGATGYSSGAIHHPAPGQAFELFQSLTRSIGYSGVERVATQLGTVRNCWMVQKSQALDLSKVAEHECVGVIGFSGLPMFDAHAVADMLSAHGVRAKPIVLLLKPKNLERWDTLLAFAKSFDQVVYHEQCLEAITQTEHGCKYLLLPPALGLNSPVGFLKSIEERTGVIARETLGLSHSIPGLRLGKTLGVGVQMATIARFKHETHRITEVSLDTGEKIAPKSVVLATGCFLSGGFVGEHETIFGLPIKNGLKVDEQQRPLGEFGELFAMNLFAAGSSLDQEEGLGRAILTGYRAGDLC